MATIRFPPVNEPLVDSVGNLSRNWYQALQSLTSNLVDVNQVVARNSQTNISWNQADETQVTLTVAHTTITNMSATDGARLSLVLIQGAGAPHTVSFTSETDFGSAGPPTLSTQEGMRDRINLVYKAAQNAFDVVSTALGFNS